MSDKVVVRFLKAWRGYSADELAGFDEAVADGLKSKGFAEAYEGDGASAAKPKTGKKNVGKSTDQQPVTQPGAGGESGVGGDVAGGDNDNDSDEKP